MKTVPVALMGCGGVGQSLIKQLLGATEVIARRNGLEFRVVALLDSESWLYENSGLSSVQLEEAVRQKRSGSAIGEPQPPNGSWLDHLVKDGLDEAQLVDVTAASGLEPLFRDALDHDYGIVLANKKPLTGPWDGAKLFFNNSRVRYESTVGGGQPVIAMLRYLLDTNDTPTEITGQLSGTLGYICTRMDEGLPFSTALAEAKANGFTEPDPREDLAGQDVMRKMLILARTIGWPLDESDFEVEALYHPSLAHLSVDEFMKASIALNPSMQDRVNAAGAAGEVLRYAAEVNEGGGAVELKPIPVENALANLKYIGMRTPHYHLEPLMVGGKGAGVAMTAAGVLGDMIGLARERHDF